MGGYKEAFKLAQAAYKNGLAVEPCPLGPEQNDQYAADEAFYAACEKGGLSTDTAQKLANLLSDTLGDPRDEAVAALFS